MLAVTSLLLKDVNPDPTAWERCSSNVSRSGIAHEFKISFNNFSFSFSNGPYFNMPFEDNSVDVSISSSIQGHIQTAYHCNIILWLLYQVPT